MMSENVHKYSGMNSDQLETAFAMIEPAGDWRAPIAASINETDFSRCALACQFYTATTLREVGRDLADGGDPSTMFVEADGYRAGDAGDH
jgi:hypothetical protein